MAATFIGSVNATKTIDKAVVFLITRTYFISKYLGILGYSLGAKFQGCCIHQCLEG